MLANRERIIAWADNAGVQRFVAWLSANAMPLFLWHTVGFALFYAVMRLVTDVPEEPSAVWWITRPLWMLGPALATLPLLAATRRIRPAA